MSTRNGVRVSVLVLLCGLLSSCGFASFEDVSRSAEYGTFVGEYFRSVRELSIYRVSLAENYQPEPSEYFVSDFEISGPEVLAAATLPAGTTLEVTKVMKCTNCYLDIRGRVQAIVRFRSTGQYSDVPVQVPIELFGSALKRDRTITSGRAYRALRLHKRPITPSPAQATAQVGACPARTRWR
jgi:hypothetical protein